MTTEAERKELEQDIRDIPVAVISGPPLDLTQVLAQHLHDLGYRKAPSDAERYNQRGCYGEAAK